MQDTERRPILATELDRTASSSSDLDKWRDRLSIVVLLFMVALAVTFATFVNVVTILQVTAVVDLPSKSLILLALGTVGGNLSLPAIYLKVLRAPPDP